MWEDEGKFCGVGEWVSGGASHDLGLGVLVSYTATY